MNTSDLTRSLEDCYAGNRTRGLPDDIHAEMALAASLYPEAAMLTPDEEQRHYDAYMASTTPAGYEDRPCRCCSAAILNPLGADPLCNRCLETAELLAGPLGPWRRELLEIVAAGVSEETLVYIVADPARSLHAYAGLDVIREVYQVELARRLAKRGIAIVKTVRVA